MTPSIVDQIIDHLEAELLAGERFAELSEESHEFLANPPPVEARVTRPQVETPPPHATAPARQDPPASRAARPDPTPAPRPESPRDTKREPWQSAPAKPDSQPSQPAPTTAQVENLSMDELAIQVAKCHGCTLCNRRNQTVFGEGNPEAGLMFIGEGPGADEDRTGRPFVGVAGQLLDDIIHAMQFKRDEVYIANIVKCRPPGNRAPEPEEAQSCLPYLNRQIELIRPQVIVTLGAVPLQHLLGIRGITRNRGKWQTYQGIEVMPTFHPSYLLRKPEAKRDVWKDMQQVMARFSKDPNQSRKR